MTLKIDAKFKEKLTLGTKNDIRNLVNLHQTTQSEYFNFYSKYMSFELKKYRGGTFHDTEVMQV